LLGVATTRLPHDLFRELTVDLNHVTVERSMFRYYRSHR
jgi:hypothetical protein